MQTEFLIALSQFIKRFAATGFQFPAIGKDIVGADTTVRADPTAGNPPLVEELNQMRAGNLQQFSGAAGGQFVVQGAQSDTSVICCHPVRHSPEQTHRRYGSVHSEGTETNSHRQWPFHRPKWFGEGRLRRQPRCLVGVGVRPTSSRGRARVCCCGLHECPFLGLAVNAKSESLGYTHEMQTQSEDGDSGPTRRSFEIRKAALELLDGVHRKGRMLSDTASPSERLSDLDSSRAMFLARTTLRWQGRSDQVLDRLIARRPHPAGFAILRLAIAEIHALGAVPELVADQAVRLIKDRGSTRHLSSLANAVLRKAAGEAGALLWADAHPGRLPEWIGAPVAETHGDETRRRIEAAHERTPPLDITPVSELAIGQIRTELDAIQLASGSLRLPGRARVSELPGYGSGNWWVQDAAAAIPVKLLGQLNGLDVLDLCAAPGGKTMQCASGGANVTAVDASESRLARLRENLLRTGLEATVVCADALDWDPGRQFDAVIADAPCTATGTIRRNPDLPVIKAGGEQAVRDLQRLQESLLRQAAALTKPGGRILYCVCSLLPSEGETIVAGAVQELGLEMMPVDCKGLGLESDWQASDGGIRTRPDHLPDLGGMDGFYSAVLRKP